MKNYQIKFSKSAPISNQGWQRAVIPIGNGHMGMCIFGNTENECLQFNEKTLWQGGPSKKRPDYNGGNILGSYSHLLGIQEALDNNDKSKVLHFKNKLVGIEEGYGNYLNFGNINIKFSHNDPKNYIRKLDINSAIASVCYDLGDDKFQREHFANYPSNVIVSKMTSAKKNLNLTLSLNIDRNGAKLVYDKNSITASGHLEDNGLAYYAKLALVSDGKLLQNGKEISLSEASYCEFYLAAATDYAPVYPHYRGKDPKAGVEDRIKTALAKGYDKLRAEHILDYKSLYDRTILDFGATESSLDTDELVSNYKKNTSSIDARYYEEILFAYGRYLIISSSRGGSLPANLQGVWNNSNNPTWGCDYHLNVNLQMCYWHAYVGNLAELALPMIDYMETLRVAGRVTAKEYHNIVSTKENPENGWVCHTQCTPFGWTCPGWEFNWGWSPAASSWMMQNCFDYYSFTEDKEILAKKIYPMMKENAKFWLQNLVYNKSQNRWVSSPSYSPEHGPVSVGNTYEQEMISMLFADTIRAGEILGDDKKFLDKLKEIKATLKPLYVGKWGQLKEWFEEDEWYKFPFMKKFADKTHFVQTRHRHASHLIGLYPAFDINSNTPDLLEAAKVSLKDRGLGGHFVNSSGWGKANKINMWARLKDGDNAYKMIVSLLQNNIADNLWDLHPPFQMDGNCGYTAGVSEMLLYSDFDHIELLPALPKQWSEGSILGICARGGFVVDIAWKAGKLTEYTIHHKSKNTAKIKINGKLIEIITNTKTVN